MMRPALLASNSRSFNNLAGCARNALPRQSCKLCHRPKIRRSSHTHHMSKLSIDYSSLLMQRRCHARYLSNLSSERDDNNHKPFPSSKSAKDSSNQTPSSSNLNIDLEPPNISRILSILKPEVSSLLLALGALTVSTAATLQFPNAIGEMIDILSSGGGVSTMDSLIVDGNNFSSDVTDMAKNIDGTAAATLDADINSSSDSNTTQLLEEQQQQQQKLTQIQSIALQMIGFFTIGSAATFYHTTSFDTIGQKIGARLRKQLFSTIIHQNITFFDQNRGGELANRLSTDVHEVAEHLVQNISIFMSNMVRSITAVVSMMAISPALTLYLTPLPIALGGCAAAYGTFIKFWSKKHLDVLAHSTHMATERFGGITTVLSFGRRQSEVTNYSNVVESAYVFARKVAVFQGAFLGSSYLVGNTALLGTLVVGATFVIDGSMTAGMFSLFVLHK